MFFFTLRVIHFIQFETKSYIGNLSRTSILPSSDNKNSSSSCRTLRSAASCASTSALAGTVINTECPTDTAQSKIRTRIGLATVSPGS
jgi:hypothetical protein